MMWFKNGHVVDVASGAATALTSIGVVGGHIDVLEEGLPPRSADPVDLRGAYVLPGLISAHTHLSVVYPFSSTNESEPASESIRRAAGRARQAVCAGITTIRCLHEQNQADLSLRGALTSLGPLGPRILGAGRAISTTGGHGAGMGCVYADGADEFLRASRVELAAGADHLKVFITGGIADPFEGFDVAQMTRAEMVAVVETAAQHGTYVAAHAGSSAAIRVAIDAGIRGFEHGYHLDLSTAELMAANDCFLTPTLCVTHLPGWMERHHFSSEQIRRAVEVGDAHLESTQRAIAAGVTLVNGTDYPPGSEDDGVPVAIREIELLAGAGLSPLEALRTATTNAANLVRMDDLLGQVRVGFAADFLVVDGNPIEDVTVLRHIRGVVRGGELLRYDA